MAFTIGIGVLSILAGVLIIAFPSLIRFLLGGYLILMGIFALIPG